LHGQYASVRGDVALSLSELLPIPAASQPCAKFGIHRALPTVQQLYESGEAAFIANVGPLIEPITKAEYKAGSKRAPPSLFSHNSQSKVTQSVHAGSTSADGVLGRIANTLASQPSPYRTRLFSVAGNPKILSGATTDPDVISAWGGVVRCENCADLEPSLTNLLSRTSSSVFAEHYSASVTSALNRTEVLSSQLDGVSLSQQFPRTHIGRQLEAAAKVISARSHRGAERDGFFVSIGGFDTHDDMNTKLASLLAQVDAALAAFVAEMKAQGAWDETLLLSASEFGRTLTSNGLGTDHAWGGNHFAMGGSVRGGQILGTFPDDLRENAALNIGRGRLIPTTSWEAVWHAVAGWLDVDAASMTKVLPNLANFAPEQLFSRAQLFTSR